MSKTWWYFYRDGIDLELAQNIELEDRPVDAIESKNPHAPWYKNYNHFDDEHVHVFAKDYESALILAENLIFNNN